MPIMNGYEFMSEVNKLMANDTLKSCFLVATTADVSEKENEKCKDMGANFILEKPIKAKKLEALLNQFNINIY